MKVFSKIMIAAWLFATITSLHAFKVEKDFTSIFNGKDLNGWEGTVSYTHLPLPTILLV